ncbi:hypothetical protein OPIT5_00295 (plasmid) [Opitutaceae bacterium TAV5]|nr:hypothetical protein OPIT5_00295 [Opitutaceae bacterium TAV5]
MFITGPALPIRFTHEGIVVIVTDTNRLTWIHRQPGFKLPNRLRCTPTKDAVVFFDQCLGKDRISGCFGEILRSPPVRVCDQLYGIGRCEQQFRITEGIPMQIKTGP